MSMSLRRGVSICLAMLWLSACTTLQSKAVCHGPWVPVNSDGGRPNG